VTTVEDALARATAPGPDGRGRFRAPFALQSWPGVVHGGALVAILDVAAQRLAPVHGARLLEGRLTASVPLDTELELEGSAGEGVIAVSVVAQDRSPLTSLTVRSLSEDPAPTPTAWPGGDGLPVPGSEHCLVCGDANELGLRVRPRFDEDGVWARVSPGPPWVERSGALHRALAPVLLDEVAWWLGAITMQAGGLTNRISLSVSRAAFPAGGPLIASGRFDDVTPVDRRRAFWRTVSTLRTPGGQPLATATIVFRGGADYSARQMPYLRARCAPGVFARMFPALASADQ
jgi:acyl-coenzyme A thioesterase PaaI-like protein